MPFGGCPVHTWTDAPSATNAVKRDLWYHGVLPSSTFSSIKMFRVNGAERRPFKRLTSASETSASETRRRVGSTYHASGGLRGRSKFLASESCVLSGAEVVQKSTTDSLCGRPLYLTTYYRGSFRMSELPDWSGQSPHSPAILLLS